jgi:hypothetical protein
MTIVDEAAEADDTPAVHANGELELDGTKVWTFPCPFCGRPTRPPQCSLRPRPLRAPAPRGRPVVSNHAGRRHRPGRRATTRARLAEADANAPQPSCSGPAAETAATPPW